MGVYEIYNICRIYKNSTKILDSCSLHVQLLSNWNELNNESE